MVPHRLSVAEAVDHLVDYLGRVSDNGETFVIVKDDKPIAELRPLPKGVRGEELAEILAAMPRLTPEEAEAFGRDIDDARASLSGEINNPVGTTVDEDALRALWERGHKAWGDIESATEWVESIRGNG